MRRGRRVRAQIAQRFFHAAPHAARAAAQQRHAARKGARAAPRAAQRRFYLPSVTPEVPGQPPAFEAFSRQMPLLFRHRDACLTAFRSPLQAYYVRRSCLTEMALSPPCVYIMLRRRPPRRSRVYGVMEASHAVPLRASRNARSALYARHVRADDTPPISIQYRTLSSVRGRHRFSAMPVRLLVACKMI